MDDGRLALVQAGHGLAGVAEDVEDLGLAEAHVEPLVHLLDHLARCKRGGDEEESVGCMPLCLNDTWPDADNLGGFTFTVLHEDQHLPDAVRHGADG